MFKKAIKKNFSYTRPLLIGERVFGNDNVMSGIGTFIILNEEGYILTCKHIAEKIRTAELLDQKYENYLKEIQGKNDQEIKKINKKYDYIDKIFQIKNIFMNCFEDGVLDTIIFHENLDLALIKFSNFKKVLCDDFPTFSSKKLEVGESICRLGFPWPSYNCFEVKNDKIELMPNANFDTPAFPLDGMITRFIVEDNEIVAFETSTPGLKGQSGGPVFDVHGNILGLQSATGHLDLMFDIEFDLERNQKIDHMYEKQFINLGLAISNNQIIKFLDENKIKYNKK